MRAHLVVLAFAALLGLSGCPEDCPDCEPPCFPGAPSAPPPPGLLLVGEPVRLTFIETIIISGGCDDGPNGHPSATSEVYDPRGALLPSEVLFDSVSASHTLQFTPERPGPHHIYVLFSPRGGLHQFDVQVGADRSAEAPLHTLPTTCSSLERTRQGAWVCDSAIYRGESLVGRLDGARLAVAGDVVWAVESSRLRRFVDTGTELSLTASLAIPSDSSEFLLAAPDELLVLHTSTLVRYTASGGTLQASSARASWRGQVKLGALAPRGVLLREGDQLAVVSVSGDSLDVQACPYQLTPAGPERKQAPCQKLPGALAGFEPSVLWEELPFSSGANRGTLRRWVWTGGQLMEQGLQPLNEPLEVLLQPLVQRSTAVPLVRTSNRSDPLTAVVTWSPTLRTLLFERLDKEIHEGFASASLYWGPPATPENARTMRIRDRPSSP